MALIKIDLIENRNQRRRSFIKNNYYPIWNIIKRSINDDKWKIMVDCWTKQVDLVRKGDRIYLEFLLTVRRDINYNCIILPNDRVRR